MYSYQARVANYPHHQHNGFKQDYNQPSTSHAMQQVSNYLMSIPQVVNPYLLDLPNVPRTHGSTASVHSAVEVSNVQNVSFSNYNGRSNTVSPIASNNRNKMRYEVLMNKNGQKSEQKQTANDKDSNKSITTIVLGDSDMEKNRFFMGTIERVLKWHKIYKNNLCFYEVIAVAISIQEGSVRQQKIMLLRDNRGPVLQVIYYTNTRINLEDFFLGQKLRCVGRMIGGNIMSAIRIKPATENDVAYLQRHCYITDHAITNLSK